MAELSIRWSAIEALKPYASPFGVTFIDESGEPRGGIAVNGPDLLYYRQFQQAVLRLAGELFSAGDVDASGDPQRAWLDLLAGKLPAFDALELRPESFLDEPAHERRFRFVLVGSGTPESSVDSSVLTDYQELQAAIAHLTGRLYRDVTLESIADSEQRRGAWLAALRTALQRPSTEDRLAEAWPW